MDGCERRERGRDWLNEIEMDRYANSKRGKMVPQEVAFDDLPDCLKEHIRVTEESRNPKDIAGSRKPPLHLVPPVANILECLVLKYGADKYGEWNWRDERVDVSRYAGAALRHIASWIDGEDIDPESGLPHLAHARATLGIMLDAISLGTFIDSRGKPGRAAETIAALTRPLPDPTEVE